MLQDWGRGRRCPQQPPGPAGLSRSHQGRVVRGRRTPPQTTLRKPPEERAGVHIPPWSHKVGEGREGWRGEKLLPHLCTELAGSLLPNQLRQESETPWSAHHPPCPQLCQGQGASPRLIQTRDPVVRFLQQAARLGRAGLTQHERPTLVLKRCCPREGSQRGVSTQLRLRPHMLQCPVSGGPGQEGVRKVRSTQGLGEGAASQVQGELSAPLRCRRREADTLQSCSRWTELARKTPVLEPSPSMKPTCKPGAEGRGGSRPRALISEAGTRGGCPVGECKATGMLGRGVGSFCTPMGTKPQRMGGLQLRAAAGWRGWWRCPLHSHEALQKCLI